MISGGYNGLAVCERSLESLFMCTKDMNALWSRLYSKEFDRYYGEHTENWLYDFVFWDAALFVGLLGLGATTVIGGGAAVGVGATIGLVGMSVTNYWAIDVNAAWDQWEATLEHIYNREFDHKFKECQKLAITSNRLCQKYPAQ